LEKIYDVSLQAGGEVSDDFKKALIKILDKNKVKTVSNVLTNDSKVGSEDLEDEC
jgi:hypothetical protein